MIREKLLLNAIITEKIVSCKKKKNGSAAA